MLYIIFFINIHSIIEGKLYIMNIIKFNDIELFWIMFVLGSVKFESIII